MLMEAASSWRFSKSLWVPAYREHDSSKIGQTMKWTCHEAQKYSTLLMHHVSSNFLSMKAAYSRCWKRRRSLYILFLPWFIVPLESYNVYATHPATLSMDTRALDGFIPFMRTMKKTTSSCLKPRNGGLVRIVPGDLSDLSERVCKMSMSMSVEQAGNRFLRIVDYIHTPPNASDVSCFQ